MSYLSKRLWRKRPASLEWRQVYHSKPRGTFPLEHARHTLVDVDILTGDYHINKKLYEAMKKTKP